jgi:hypothetical protein
VGTRLRPHGVSKASAPSNCMRHLLITGVSNVPLPFQSSPTAPELPNTMSHNHEAGGSGSGPAGATTIARSAVKPHLGGGSPGQEQPSRDAGLVNISTAGYVVPPIPTERPAARCGCRCSSMNRSRPVLRLIRCHRPEDMVAHARR